MSITPANLTIYADKEHPALRNTVIFILLALLVILFLLGMTLYNLSASLADYRVFLSCVTALPLGLGIGYVIEQTLKQRWPSGRSLTLDEGSLTHQGLDDDDAVTLDWSGHINQTFWYFALEGYSRGGRERRLPKQSICVACQLQQDDERIIAHTYMMPKQLKGFQEGVGQQLELQELDPKEIYDTSLRSRFSAPTRPTIPAKLISGKNGRYWVAERRRWQDGAELEPKDFVTFVEQLQARAMKG